MDTDCSSVEWYFILHPPLADGLLVFGDLLISETKHLQVKLAFSGAMTL